LFKDKRNREEPYAKELEQKTRVLVGSKVRIAELDENGSFRIFVDRQDQNIIAEHFTLADQVAPSLIVKGKTAEQVYGQIVRSGLVSKLNHAAYLGNELGKAEIALRTGKEYIQDKKMFSEQ